MININGKEREERIDASQDKDICLLNVEVKSHNFVKSLTFLINFFLERWKTGRQGTRLCWVNSQVGSVQKHLISVIPLIYFDIFQNENVQQYKSGVEIVFSRNI